MAVKPGYYRVYIDYGFDGRTYPYSTSNLMVVSITDDTANGQIIEDNPISGYEAIINPTGFVGFFDRYEVAFQGSNAVPVNQIATMVNALGAVGISISPPADTEDWLISNPVYFKLYLDSNRTLYIGSGHTNGSSSTGDVKYFPRLYSTANNRALIFIPYIRVSTDQQHAYCSDLSGNTVGSTTRIYLNRYPGNADALLPLLSQVDPWVEDTDPYSEIDPSAPAGGDGTFDFSSTPIDFQGLPGIGAYQTGMIDLYIPSAAQLQALSNYLWAGAFDLENFRKIVADPMDAILGLSIVPVTAAEIGTGSGVLAVGNISTGITMPTASRQYVSIDCGSVNILPKYGAYLDFAPYCKLQLFLPYIGYVQISPDDCMNGAIAVRYSVDILSGMCVAQVKCNDHVLYELAGSCSCQCPVTAGQYQNIALTALRVASAGAMTGAALAAGSVGGVTGGIEDAANSIISSVKPEIERSGGFGGSSGLMGHQVPYLILTIPRMCRPLRQNQIIGYPSFVTVTLGDITGYAAVAEIHLRGIPGASDEDLAEIETLLKEGVYL